jgi:adenylosuccinate lyase
MREEGAEPDMIERLGRDPAFIPIAARFPEILDPAKYVGRAKEQVEEFLAEEVRPILERDAAFEARGRSELRV